MTQEQALRDIVWALMVELAKVQAELASLKGSPNGTVKVEVPMHQGPGL